MPVERHEWEVSWISLWRILFFAVIVAILYQSREMMFGLFLALVISSGLDPIVDLLERFKIPRTLSVVIIFLLLALGVAVILYALVPRLIIDLNNVLLQAESQPLMRGWLEPLVDISTSSSLNAAIGKFSRQILGSDTSPIDFLTQAFGGMALAMTVLVSSFYLTISRDGVERFIRVVFPRTSEEAVLRLYGRARRKLAFWFRAQIVLSFFVGLFVWAAMAILGVKHALLLGLLSALLEIVPYVGPIIAGGVGVVVALTESSSLAVMTLIVFVAIQQIEGHFFVPVLMKRSIGLHPVIVIISLVIGGQLQGILGVLIAVPAAAVLQEIVEDWSDKRRQE